jgi:uncharacterized protein
MPLHIAKAAFRFVLANARRLHEGGIDISFHGAGEPTLNWEVLTRTVHDAEEACAQESLSLTSTICTNGIMTLNNAVWLAQHIHGIVVSLDGPPEIQNVQRPTADGGCSFERVARTLDQLRELGKPYTLRVTATQLSESRLADIYAWLAERFAPQSICIEPLFSCGRCSDSGLPAPSSAAFIRDLLATLRRASGSVPVIYSGGRLSHLSDRFCGAAGYNFFVTPRGEVTSCVEVSHTSDVRSSRFFYGRFDVTSGRFVFDIDRHLHLCEMSVRAAAACNECFARWHCSGDCPAKMPTEDWNSGPRNLYRCNINREITRAILTSCVSSLSAESLRD